MSTTKKKVTLGWGFVDARGNFAADVFAKKHDAFIYSDGYEGYKMTRVKVSKYVPKKK